MRRLGISALLALSLAESAAAHRLDEYLQATLIGVTRDGVDLEIHLTPGVAMLPFLMAAIDRDHDGLISAEEGQAYVDRVAREVELRVDGAPAPLSLIEGTFPTVEAMRDGLGTIVIKLRTSRRGHELRFENRHLPQVSVYLVNCLAGSDGLVVGRQDRDEAQRSIEFQYSFGSTAAAKLRVVSLWPAAIGMLLIVRMAVLIYKRPRRVGTETRRR
ncbi:MAG TPA: hypothetical protein VK752_24430 [Bryobacteraceae bacterium]|nr:hypothetical protein [Bryobacteraceae bacterium]